MLLEAVLLYHSAFRRECPNGLLDAFAYAFAYWLADDFAYWPAYACASSRNKKASKMEASLEQVNLLILYSATTRVRRSELQSAD